MDPTPTERPQRPVLTPSTSSLSLPSQEGVPLWLRDTYNRLLRDDPTLAKVALEGSGLRSPEISSFFRAMKKNSHVIKIRFSDRSFHDPQVGILHFCDALHQHSSLRVLDLSANALVSLPNDFGDCFSQLTEMHLDNNRLSSLPLSLSAITGLRVLALSKNRLSSLPVSLSRLQQLQTLDLASNKFSSLPGFLAKLPLTSLRVKGNKKLKGLPKHVETPELLKWISEHASAEPDMLPADTILRKKKNSTFISPHSSSRRSTISLLSPRGTRTLSHSVSFTSSPESPRSADQPPNVRVQILSAKIQELDGCNPYVVISDALDGRSNRSAIRINECNPVWDDAQFLCRVGEEPDASIQLALYSHDFASNSEQLLGTFRVSAAVEGVSTARSKDQHSVTFVVERTEGVVLEEATGFVKFARRHNLTAQMQPSLRLVSPEHLLHLLIRTPGELPLYRCCFFCLHTFFPPAHFLQLLANQHENLNDGLVALFHTIFADSFFPYLEIFLTHTEEGSLQRFTAFLQHTPPFEALSAPWISTLERFAAPSFDAIPPSREASKFEFKPLLLEVPIKELAAAISGIEYEILLQIRPREFVPFVKGDTKRAPNITHLTDQFNFATNWLISEIVSTPRLAERTRMVALVIELGKEFLRVRNLQGVFEVVCALNSASISRMKRSWAELPRRSRKDFEHLEALATPIDNYRNYRLYLSGSPPPSLPYIGVVIGDLTFILDCNPDRIEGMINWDKCRMIFDAADSFLKKLAGEPSHFGCHPLPESELLIRARFQQLTPLSETRCYQLSLRIDPRVNYEESIVEMLGEEKKLLQEIARLRAVVAAVPEPLPPAPRPVASTMKAELKRKVKLRTSLMLQSGQSLNIILPVTLPSDPSLDPTFDRLHDSEINPNHPASSSSSSSPPPPPTVAAVSEE